MEHMQSRDGAHDQEKASNVPRPFPRVRDGVWERDYKLSSFLKFDNLALYHIV